MANKKSPTVQQFVVLPTRGLQARAPNSSPAVAAALLGLNALRTLSSAPQGDLSPALSKRMKVIDSIHENGAKLVEMLPEDASALRAAHPGLRVVPVVYYYPAVAPRQIVLATPTQAAKKSTGGITIQVASALDDSPVRGATVVAFTNFAAKEGAEGTTNAKGMVSLALLAATKKVERLYIYSESGYWNGLERNVTLKSGAKFKLKPIDLSYTDALRFVYPGIPLTAGAGVTVGVIDTGVAHHPDLRIAGGKNTVPGESELEFGDNGEGHGTHVAGIVAASGTPPAGVRGMAPAVALRSYRVFGQGQKRASNYAIAKAIDAAVQDRCDLINLSLGGGPADEATKSAIADARAAGSVVIAAAGNDGRQPVSFPGSDPLSIAISALGRKGTFPANTVEEGDTVPPFATSDAKYFIGAFSNVGPEIALTGPGVGIISTYPGGYAVMDGTSMACPATTGVAARLLAGKPDLLGMPRDPSRSDAIVAFLMQSARALGLGVTLEGRGLLR